MSTVEIAPTTIPAGSYTVDPAHSSFEFGVRHMMISTVRGRFLDFEATLEGGEQPRIKGSIETASAVTHDEARDGHLKSPDFFDVERYPQARFSGTLVAPDRVEGELTLKGVTKPVTLHAAVTGPDTDPWGNERVGLELTGSIDRREFDLAWNQTLPNGNLLVSNEVKLLLSVSAIKAA